MNIGQTGLVINKLAAQAATVPVVSSPMSARDTSSASGTSPNSAGGGSIITANDFLSLLVSELKNQDPTQPTDPASYIQQLVGVNSLQQLIQINQGLTAFESNTPTNAAANSSNE